MGLDTPVVSAVNHEDQHVYVKLTRKILHRGSTFARMKLKEIGGTGTKQWNMGFNSIIHAKSYQS